MGSLNYHSGVDWDLVLDADQLLISQVIERRNIRWLCHFTPRANLEGIKKNGLKTRNLLSYNEAIVTDRYRYDRYKNAICLSISKPNQYMLKRKLEQGYDLCLLLIDPAVLYKKECIFYPHNAATASFRNASPESFKGENALEELFANPITFQKSEQEPTIWNRVSSLHDYETTSAQAEVQCLESIEPEYILRIFENDIPLTYDDIDRKVLVGSAIDNSLKVEDKDIRNLERNIVVENLLEKITKERRKRIKYMVKDGVICSSGDAINSYSKNQAEKTLEFEQDNKKIESSSNPFNNYIEEKNIRDLERDVAREKRLKQIAEQISKINLTNDDIKMIKERSQRVEDWLKELEHSPSEDKQSSISKKITEFKQEVKKAEYSSSSSVSSPGDCCLGFIILVILIIIFVL